MKKLNKLQKFISNLRFNTLGDDKWYPFPYLGNEHITGKKEVFAENLIANYPSSHDGQLLGVRHNVSKNLTEQGLWRKRKNIGIHIINDREAGPNSGCWNRDCEYKLYYLK